MRERYDVAIVGGGPAGCLTALLLAREGCAVAVLDRPRRGTVRVGETLPPAATRLLAKSGLLERFLAAGPRSSPGIVSAWGSAEPQVIDYLFSPHGEAWHVDRHRFDALLREVAIEAGADFFAAQAVRSGQQAYAEGGWRLQAGPDLQLTCTILVDASGRCAASGLPYSARRIYDRLTTTAGFAETEVPAQAVSDYTLVEAVRDGWFYSALLPDTRYIVTFTTDADVHARGRRRSTAYLNEQLADAPLTRERVLSFPVKTETFSALSMKRSVAARPNWIAVGDAARSYDPLTGLGLFEAMRSAHEAAAVIREMLAGSTAAAERYERAHHHTFASYLEKRRGYYSLEKRWPGSVFWKRRTYPESPVGAAASREKGRAPFN